MNKEQLKAKQLAASEAMDALFAKADEEKRALTAEERTQLKASEKEYDDATAAIKAIEEDDAVRSKAALANQSRGRHSAPNAGDRIKVLSEGFEKDPKKGFKDHREFLSLVMDAGNGKSAAINDPRLKFLTAGSDEAGTYGDSVGGFFVPTDFSPDFLQVNPEDDPIAGRTTMVPMGAPAVKIPARVDKDHRTSVTGGLQVTRRAETQTQNPTRMTLEQVELQAFSLFGLSYATEELLTDSPRSFVAILEKGFSEEFTNHMINEKLNGTGVGEYEGINNSPAMLEVPKATGQAAATLVYENILTMRARCWGYTNAIWLANHDCVPQLMLLNQSVGTGGVPVWQPSAREDHPDTLLGRPLIFTEYTETVGTAGDIVLANWGEYLEGLYQPMNSAESIHVRFVNHERTFKFWMRNAGRGWWRSTLTPKKSAFQMSPFVRLATRA
jgi:HK97 family phage major capsid protein